MPISHRLQALFVHVPKTGGTSVESALGMHGPWQIENRETLFGLIQSPDLIKRRYASAFLQHLRIAELIDLLGEAAVREQFSFSFVRNPWDRMISIYHRTDPHLVQQACDAGIELTGLPFGEFLARTAELRHAHLAVQADYLYDTAGRLQVDFVGRYETIVQDFAVVCTRLGTQAALPCLNASTHDGYRSYYDTHTRRLIGERYARDIEAFGYTF